MGGEETGEPIESEEEGGEVTEEGGESAEEAGDESAEEGGESTEEEGGEEGEEGGDPECTPDPDEPDWVHDVKPVFDANVRVAMEVLWQEGRPFRC